MTDKQKKEIEKTLGRELYAYEIAHINSLQKRQVTRYGALFVGRRSGKSL